MTPSVSSNSPLLANPDSKGLAAIDPDRCTTGCTSWAEIQQTGTVEALAAALQALSPADRARLAAILLGEGKTTETARAPDPGLPTWPSRLALGERSTAEAMDGPP